MLAERDYTANLALLGRLFHAPCTRPRSFTSLRPFASLVKLRSRVLTVNRLANHPIQRQQRILHILILQRPLQPHLVDGWLPEGFDDDNGVADQGSGVSGYEWDCISTDISQTLVLLSLTPVPESRERRL